MLCMCCAHWPGKLHYYHTVTSADTDICCSINSTWNWWTYCDLALLFLLSLPEKCFARNIFLSAALSPLWILTAAWITKVATWVMNQLKSHHIERLWVTLSSPSDPNPSLWASPNELFICYSEIRMRHVAGTEVLWRIALHANVVLQSLSPTNQQFCSKLICIQQSHILPTCTAWKYEFHSSPVWCSWNCLEFRLNCIETRAFMRIFYRFLWSKTCYYLMFNALIWLMYNAPALKAKFNRDDWSCDMTHHYILSLIENVTFWDNRCLERNQPSAWNTIFGVCATGNYSVKLTFKLL